MNLSNMLRREAQVHHLCLGSVLQEGFPKKGPNLPRNMPPWGWGQNILGNMAGERGKFEG